MSTATATATMETSIDRANLHASFENVDENETSTFTTIDIFKYNENMHLIVGQDIHDQYGNYVSSAWGYKILTEEEFQVKRNLKSAVLTSEIELSQWNTYNGYTTLSDIAVTWKSDEKAEVTHYNKNDPEYPKVQDLYVSCETTATGCIDGTTLGTGFHSYAEIYMSI